MIGIILGTLWFMVILYIDIQSDYKRIESNGINHKRGAILRTIGLLPSFGCFLFPLDSLTISHILFKILIISGLLFSWWWELFDGLLNMKRKKSWRYNGSDDSNDAVSDNILQKLSPLQQGLLKWSLILTFTILYYVLYT